MSDYSDGDWNEGWSSGPSADIRRLQQGRIDHLKTKLTASEERLKEAEGASKVLIENNERLLGQIQNLTRDKLIATEAMESAIKHIGVPQAGYPAPVGFAYDELQNALTRIRDVLPTDSKQSISTEDVSSGEEK